MLAVLFALLCAPAAFADRQSDLAAAESNVAAAEGNVAAAGDATAAAESNAAAAEGAVEASAWEYDQAIAAVDELESQIAQLQERIDTLQAQVPGQRDAANKALVAIYKMQQEGCSLLDMLLSSENIMDFFNRLQALNRIQSANTAKLNEMLTLQNELNADQEELDRQRAAAEEQRALAEEALAAAQAERERAQAAAEDQRQAEFTAIADLEAAKEALELASIPPDANTGSSLASEEPMPETIENVVSKDGADWGTDKATFVSSWGARINAYLAGSPLGGYGEVFAAAAWDYGVDPRWSPAISLVESSKGMYCFLPHNAWGWGSSSWDSWEEAIDAHVRGLSRGYGYTVSIPNAQKYCPPNWQHWYNTCVSEMEKI